MPSVTAPVIVLQTPSVTLYYHPDAKIVHHEIRKFVTGKDFRDLLTAGGDQMRKNLAKKWLSDDRGQWVLRKDDIAWSESMWAPNTVRAGWKYWAAPPAAPTRPKSVSCRKNAAFIA